MLVDSLVVGGVADQVVLRIIDGDRSPDPLRKTVRQALKLIHETSASDFGSGMHRLVPQPTKAPLACHRTKRWA